MHTRFEHYDIYYGTVMACTLLSNDGSPEFRRDAAAIVDFYCAAHGLDRSVAEGWKTDVLDTLSRVESVDERDAAYRRRMVSSERHDRDYLYDVKGDVLAEICTKYKDDTVFINRAWFDYSHVHCYNAQMRFAQIRSAASSGWRVAAREVGIMQALGIGCVRDVDAAVYRFMQCAYWCDVPSCYIAAYLMREAGDEAVPRSMPIWPLC